MDLFAHFLRILIRSIGAIVLIGPVLCLSLGLPEEIHVFVVSWVGNEVFFDILIDKLLDCEAIAVEDVALKGEGRMAQVFAHCQHLKDSTIGLALLAHQCYIHKY